MAAANDLTTLEDLKEWLGMETPPITASDDLLSRLITAMSTYIANVCSRVFQSQTYTEVRNGLGSPVMSTLQLPITAVSSVTVNGLVIPPRQPLGPGTTTGQGGFTFDSNQIQLSRYTFVNGWQNVELVYTAGYTTIPYDLAQACIDLCTQWFRYKDRVGKSSESIQGQSISVAGMVIPPQTLDIIAKYNSVAPIY